MKRIDSLLSRTLQTQAELRLIYKENIYYKKYMAKKN